MPKTNIPILLPVVPRQFTWTSVAVSSGVPTTPTEGVKTFTAPADGLYRINLMSRSSHNNTYTSSRLTWALAGTATRLDSFGTSINNDGTEAQDADQYEVQTLIVQATAGQTITMTPTYQCNFSGGSHNGFFYAVAEYIGKTIS